jgi:Na+(H+)/acetate symporter ActP
MCSLTYVFAQIYGAGLITSRLAVVHYEIGILHGFAYSGFWAGLDAFWQSSGAMG